MVLDPPSPSFWFDMAGAVACGPALSQHLKADVCVVGGGVTGLSAAYHLISRSPGLSVVVLEANTVGFGASGRNAGQLIVAFGGGDIAAQVRRHGRENFGIGLDYVHSGILGMQELAAVEGFDYDYSPTGYLKAGLRVERGAELERHLRLYESVGHGHHFTYLDQNTVEEELHSPLLGGALFDPRGGQFNPLKLVRGLRDSVVRRGVTVCEMSAVTAVHTAGARIKIETAGGSVDCEKLVLATNGFSHRLSGIGPMRLNRSQMPLIVLATVTEPLSSQGWDPQGWPSRCGVNVLSQLFYSFAPTQDGRVLWVGGYNTYAPDVGAPLPQQHRELNQDHILGEFFPRLAHIRTARTWSGPISITADWTPQVGFARDRRIVYAWGCWGHGMAIGFHNGSTMADLTLAPYGEASRLWFVSRSKRRWPPILGSIVAKKVISDRRRGNRKIAARIGIDLGG